jgi:transcriptional regulator with XRE-family HTH domain
MATPPYPNLNAELARTLKPIYVASAESGVSGLSKIKNGAREPSAGERARLAQYLQAPEDYLFRRADALADEGPLLMRSRSVPMDHEG